MSVSSIASTSAASTSGTTTAATLPVQTLSQQDFLTLLVQQMTNQDPMNPQSNTDFAAQMAQFTALQTAQTSGTDIAGIRSDQTLLEATSMLGKTVNIQVDSSTTAQGVVSGVQNVAGTPKLVVNGQNYDVSQVTALTPTTTP